MDAQYLEHYGVLGMKWGVRKDGKPQGWKPNGTRRKKTEKNTKKDAKKGKKNAKKYAKRAAIGMGIYSATTMGLSVYFFMRLTKMDRFLIRKGKNYVSKLMETMKDVKIPLS